MPEWDISSLGAMGWRVEVAGEFFRRRRRRPPSPKCFFANYKILCFLTHVRDLDALLPGNGSQFRCGSFLFSGKLGFLKNKPKYTSKNKCDF